MDMHSTVWGIIVVWFICKKTFEEEARLQPYKNQYQI